MRTLERYLVATSLIASVRPETASSVSILVEEYANYLHEVRGLASDTIAHRRHTAQWFLQHLDEEGITLKKIHRSHLDSYITTTGKRLCRTSLQHDISALRVFLRFLAGVSQSSAKSGTISWRVKKIAVAFRIYHGSVERRDGVESFRQSLMRLIDFFGLPAHTRSSFATCYVD